MTTILETLLRNPFEAAIEYYEYLITIKPEDDIVLGSVITAITSDLNTQQNTTLALDFIVVLSRIAYFFFPHRVVDHYRTQWEYFDPTDMDYYLSVQQEEHEKWVKNYIYPFVGSPCTNAEDFLFILEKSYLYWEEVRPSTTIPLAEVSLDTFVANDPVARFFVGLRDLVSNCAVSASPSPEGLKVYVPSNLAQSFLDQTRTTFYMDQLVGAYPKLYDAWPSIDLVLNSVCSGFGVRYTDESSGFTVNTSSFWNFAKSPEVDEEIFAIFLDECVEMARDMAMEEYSNSTQLNTTETAYEVFSAQ